MESMTSRKEGILNVRAESARRRGPPEQALGLQSALHIENETSRQPIEDSFRRRPE